MTKSKEDAVSPVIGVILMVAVTVILAAVIAAFVFGMGSNIGKTKVVAMTASRSADGTAIFVTYQGGQDHPSVASVGSNCNAGNPSGAWRTPPNGFPALQLE
ncbi:MAG TPA: type IV pilin N-terminal domain-containing protein, partial [Methanoregulaceae archaeon]|nr:type IV pilin N-terminal domain-containing protein [Methanoregulaceae archaeon]